MAKPGLETARKVIFAAAGAALIAYGVRGFADHSITVINRHFELAEFKGQKAMVASGAVILCGLLCFFGLIRSMIRWALLLVALVAVGAYVWVHYYAKNY